MSFGGLADLGLKLVGGAGAHPVESPGAFIIEELSGQRRKVILIGRGLPYRPLELTGVQRVTTTWLPGFAEATATVMGAKDEPTVINGMWKDRFIQKPSSPNPTGVAAITGAVRNGITAVSGALSGGFGPDPEFKAPITVQYDNPPSEQPMDSVRDAAEVIDSIRAEGQLVEVTWDVQCRRGLLDKFVQRWQNAHDLEWEMQFTWISRGVKPQVAAAERSTASVVDDIKQVVSDLGAIVNEVGAIADTLDDLVLSQMQALNTLVEKLGDAAASVNKLINLPSSATRRIVATLSSVIAQARAIGDSFELQPFADQHRKAQRADGFGGTSTRNAALTKTGPAGNVDASASSRVTAVETIDRADVAHRAKRAARAVAAMAALRRAQMMYALETDILDIYTAKSGDNLRDVAFKISRNADEWKKIMLFNGLSTPALTAGQVVLVPKSSSEGFCASILP